MKRIEYEQKFLFDYLPYNKLQFKQKTIVYRNYLSFEPEIRINRRTFNDGVERFHLIVKKPAFNMADSCIVRCSEKIRLRLTAEEYQEFLSSISQQELIFDVYDFFLDKNHVIGFKCCRNPEISFAEIEYADEMDFKANESVFSSFSFLKKNITFDDRFNVKQIWSQLNTNKIL